MTRAFAFLFILVAGAAGAGTPPMLPSADVVARVIDGTPAVQAARAQVQVEEANRRRLEAGSHEWEVRVGGQQRRTYPGTGPDERYPEWSAALERPLRLPAKASLDGEIGARGVNLAEAALGDARHEAGRALLKAWFAWLRENAAAGQWTAQVALLERQAQAVHRRQQLGDAARLEAVQADAALAQAEAQLAQALLRQRTAREDMRRRYPGLPLAAPESLAEPQPVDGGEAQWVDAVLEHSHEVAVARGETARARLASDRVREDRLPDPSIGMHIASERGGEEHILGAYIAIPLPGEARRASADAALAGVDVADRRAAGIAQKAAAEAAALYQTAQAGVTTWLAARNAAERLARAAKMTARAYQLGEGTLAELLNSRRLANEASLAAGLGRLDALESRYRLLLDAHRLWDSD